MQNPPTSSTSPSSSQASHTPSLQTPFGRASNHRTKRNCPPQLDQNGTRSEYPPCHLVWPSVLRWSWSSIVLRRAGIVPDGTSVEALAIIKTMVTTQLHIALAWCQRHAGISTPILEFPATTLPHLETSFFLSLRTYLASTKSAIILENSHITPHQ
jgi:hypothetical protein